MKRLQHKNKGFTLPELLTVLTVMVVIVVIAVPNVARMMSKAKQKAFTDEFVGFVQFARVLAMREGKVVGFCIASQNTNTCDKVFNNGDVTMSSDKFTQGKATPNKQIALYYKGAGTTGDFIKTLKIPTDVVISDMKRSEGDLYAFSATGAAGLQVLSTDTKIMDANEITKDNGSVDTSYPPAMIKKFGGFYILYGEFCALVKVEATGFVTKNQCIAYKPAG